MEILLVYWKDFEASSTELLKLIEKFKVRVKNISWQQF